jgi:hypothetical protein
MPSSRDEDRLRDSEAQPLKEVNALATSSWDIGQSSIPPNCGFMSCSCAILLRHLVISLSLATICRSGSFISVAIAYQGFRKTR